MKIRPVRPEEYDATGELVVEAYGTVPDRAGETRAYEPVLRDTAFRAASAEVLVAVEHDGTLLGTVTYVDGPGEFQVSDDPAEAGVRMLAVAPGARGRGVGAALMQACIDRARANERKRLALYTEPTMTAAQRLYARLGFRRAGEHDWEPFPGFVLMAYELAL